MGIGMRTQHTRDEELRARKLPAQHTHEWNRPAAAGNILRINLFRSQGPSSARHQIAWQAPMSETFHVPERFGLLKLVKQEK